MRTIKVGKIEVAVVATAGEWELFSSSMNCDVATKALNDAVDRCAKAVAQASAKRLDVGKRTLLALYKKELVPVMSRYSRFGASDSEPDYHACATLRKIASAAMGTEVDFSRDDT